LLAGVGAERIAILTSTVFAALNECGAIADDSQESDDARQA
jgi:hypothetical protein